MSITPPNRCHDVNKLLPYVAERVLQLLDAMRERGFDPMVYETLRDKKRQYYLFCQGRTAKQAFMHGVPKKYADAWARPGIVVTQTLKSKHLVGKAADVVSQSTLWSDPKFFTALAEEAKKVGLHTLGFERCHCEWQG